jgi:hypothetical protein
VETCTAISVRAYKYFPNVIFKFSISLCFSCKFTVDGNVLSQLESRGSLLRGYSHCIHHTAAQEVTCSLCPANCLVRDAALNLKTEDIIMCCPVTAIGDLKDR